MSNVHVVLAGVGGLVGRVRVFDSSSTNLVSLYHTLYRWQIEGILDHVDVLNIRFLVLHIIPVASI